MIGFPGLFLSVQVLRYFDYVFTGVFTFEMVIKVRTVLGTSTDLLRRKKLNPRVDVLSVCEGNSPDRVVERGRKERGGQGRAGK